MSLILNIETATTVCSVAIAKDGKLIAIVEQDGDYSHSENLTLFISQACKKAGLELSNLDAIAISKAPGSYTGLRIGVSTAKGLCYSLNKPLVSINTLQHMALSISKNTQPEFDKSALYCPMIDARRMEVYCAIYNSANHEQEATSAEIINENSFEHLLKNKQVVFFGNGSNKCEKVFSKNSNAKFISDIAPSAKNMISLSEQAFTSKRFEDIAYFEPFYLKEFMAIKPSAKK